MAEQLPNWKTNNVEDLRRFSRIRLIVADLDGTLIPSDLSHTIQELICSLNHYRYQVNFTIATGRTLSSVEPLLQKLSLTSNVPLVLYNGSLVVRNKTFTVIDRKTISVESLRQILNISSNYKVRTFAYSYTDNDKTKPLFSLRDSESRELVFGWASNCNPGREFNNMNVQWLDNTDYLLEPSAVLIETSSDPEGCRAIETMLSDISGISLTRSGFNYIEVRPKASNKGIALECIAKDQNLTPDEILTLGDNDNDAEMLAWAGIGVAVAKASPFAVQNSDFVCRYGVFEGAVEILRLVKHARYYYFDPKKRNYLDFETV